MSNIQIFSNPEFGEIRTVDMNGEPWFVGKDVAVALGHTNPQRAVRDYVDAEDKGVTENVTPGGKQLMTIINESGMYSMVLSSKLEGAKRFKHWVTSEVLPSIRKNGGYIAGQEELSPAELMAKALLAAQKTLADREARIESLTKENQLMKPKADVCDAISASEDSIPIKNFANILSQNGVKIGQNRLFTYFRENGYLINSPYSPRHNTPTQKAMDLKLFTVQERAVLNSGGARITYTSRLTPKGQQYFLNKFLNIA